MERQEGGTEDGQEGEEEDEHSATAAVDDDQVRKESV